MEKSMTLRTFNNKALWMPAANVKEPR